jgi:hypothetical protein
MAAEADVRTRQGLEDGDGEPVGGVEDRDAAEEAASTAATLEEEAKGARQTRRG